MHSELILTIAALWIILGLMLAFEEPSSVQLTRTDQAFLVVLWPIFLLVFLYLRVKKSNDD